MTSSTLSHYTSIVWDHLINKVHTLKKFRKDHQFPADISHYINQILKRITTLYALLENSHSETEVFAKNIRIVNSATVYNYPTNWVIDKPIFQKVLKHFNQISKHYKESINKPASVTLNTENPTSETTLPITSISTQPTSNSPPAAPKAIKTANIKFWNTKSEINFVKQIAAAHNQQKQSRSSESHRSKSGSLGIESELSSNAKDLDKNLTSLPKTAQSEADSHLTQLSESSVLNHKIYILDFIDNLSFQSNHQWSESESQINTIFEN